MLTDRFAHQVPAEFIERTTDVKLDTPVILPASLPGHGYRIRGRFIQPIPVRVWMKELFKLSFDSRLHNLLGDPVSDSGDGQRRLHSPQTAIWDG